MSSEQASDSWACIEDVAAEERQRQQVLADPGAYHGNIAAAELHWYDPDHGSWARRDPVTGTWGGFDAASGAILHGDRLRESDWRPWAAAFDATDAPFFRWFQGGLTNACFNEVDRHVLAGRGASAAFIFEGDRWDPSKNEGQGGPVFELDISFRRLFYETVLRAEVLRGLGLKKGDRVAFNLPNIPEQLYYTAAAKRLGIIYTPVFGGFSAKTLSDRIADAGAEVVVTADGGYRNAEVVTYKESFTDQALDNYVPLPRALEALSRVLATFSIGGAAERLESAVRGALHGEITIERSDVMRELGRALAQEQELAPEQVAEVRTTVARELAEVQHIVRQVVVVKYTGQEIVEQVRDRWSDPLVQEARQRLLNALGDQGNSVADEEALLALDDRALWAALAGVVPAEPVDSDWPLFIIYTSGSTGKPKGVVHTHGGWLAGVAHTLRVVFNAQEGDRIYTIADPGWILGQSYLIGAPLAVGITSIVAEGSPLFPHAGRFSSIIARHGATIFKAGSTFLKAVMTDPASTADMAAFDMTKLKAGTFCAEPVSPPVQQFAMERICEHYINSYWATEHGGIVFTCPWGGFKPLAADAKTWALPWIQAEVRVPTETNNAGQATAWRVAEEGEKGELVITQPYPYLARTIWGDPDSLGTPAWRGDLTRFRSVYFDRWADDLVYTQGDFARTHADRAITLHGRSDDVINVSGHRVGTEEIEGAILRDKALRADSPVGNAVVVGAPDEEKGETPVAFIIPAPGARIQDEDLARLTSLVRTEKGATAVPSDYLIVSAFPETRSGKYMRRTLRGILLDEPLGDLSTLRNPEVVDEIISTVAEWRAFGNLAAARDIVQSYRYLRVENHELAPGRMLALITISAPPVNSLNERSLDELNTVLQHVKSREDVAVVVITGAGNAFVAGADVKELLEVGEAGDLDSAQTPPNAAHTAFSTLEQLGKPVIAAVNGPALGGGNELVLACSYVVADGRARFGQPEINLNLMPGYGGTQRLPRKLLRRRGEDGLLAALRIIFDGRSFDVREAEQIGLVDQVVADAGPVESAVAIARQYLAGEGPLVAAAARHEEELRQRDEPFTIAAAVLEQPTIAAAIAQLRHSGRSRPVERLIDAIRFGAERGQTAGLKHEAGLFAEAVCDPDSGPVGIRAFLEKRSAPLPVRHQAVPPDVDEEGRRALEAAGRLLPLDAAFYPGVTPVPEYQYGMGVHKDAATGMALHADPAESERLLVFPTPEPGPNEALIYILASE
ncbi:MAG: AMP-binding protein, partial [Pseudomonadota bacterium]